MEGEKDPPGVKLARIVRESDSYEELLVRVRSDEEASDFLEKLSMHWAGLSRWFNGSTTSVPDLYRVMKRHADKAEATDRV